MHPFLFGQGRGFKTLDGAPISKTGCPIGGCIPAALSPSAVRVSGKRLRIFSFTYHTEHADNLPDTQTFKISAQSCKFAEPARISSEAKMLPNHISIARTRQLGRIDNVALKRWALFTVE